MCFHTRTIILLETFLLHELAREGRQRHRKFFLANSQKHKERTARREYQVQKCWALVEHVV